MHGRIIIQGLIQGESRFNGMWNGGILEWQLMTLYCFYLYKWTNWACALEIDVGMVWMRGYLQVESASKGACACVVVLCIAIAI